MQRAEVGLERMAEGSVASGSAAFGKPFAFQVAAFRLRLAELKGTAKWTDVWQAEHDRAFMVAGAMKADLLADLAAAVDKSISQGATLETFRKDFRAIVEKHGWHGWTGEGTKGGEAWRTRVIYRTNLATSYAAGRHAQLVKAGFPFWVYRHGASLEPRQQHLAWDGIVLEAGHPFWATHAPPNGWGCSCYVVGSWSRESATRRGGKPDKHLPEGWQKTDPRTGAPVGIDKGWAYAPGASAARTVAMLADKLDALPSGPSVDLIQSWLRMDAFADWLKAPVDLWPVARIAQLDAERIGAQTTIAKLSAETARKQIAEHPELTGLDYLMVQRVVDAAQHRQQDTNRSIIFIFEEPGDGGYVLVVKATISGRELFVTSFRRLSIRADRRQREIQRLLGKG